MILGGGFAGVYTAKYLAKSARRDPDLEIHLVNRENYFVFQPMLPEVVSGNVGPFDTVSPIRRIVPQAHLHIRNVEAIDLDVKTVTLSPGVRPRPDSLPFDYLVLALGNVTDFRGMPGLHDHALPFKNLVDAINLRNHLINALAEADVESDPKLRRQLLTFVVAGGGFSGVEVAAELNDFVRRVARSYHEIDPAEIRVVLIHSGERLLNRELVESLGLYAQKNLRKRGVEIILNQRLKSASPEFAVLQNDERIETRTLVSTVPSSPNPLLEKLGLPLERGRVKVDRTLQAEGRSDVWALGDCALIPDPTGSGFCPPTAQFAIREADVAAHNIEASWQGREPKEFHFKELGKMGALGHRNAVAQVLGIKVSGILAWFMWRTVYWWKMPGLDRKIRVGFDWLLDLIIPPDLVQLKLNSAPTMVHMHFEPGEEVIHQGDQADKLYIVLSGSADMIWSGEGDDHVLNRLGQGEYFGAVALLDGKPHGVSIRCVESLEVLAFHKREFDALVSTLPQLRQGFEKAMHDRLAHLRDRLDQEHRHSDG